MQSSPVTVCVAGVDRPGARRRQPSAGCQRDAAAGGQQQGAQALEVVEHHHVDAVADDEREAQPERQAQEAGPQPAEDRIQRQVLHFGGALVLGAHCAPVGELGIGGELDRHHRPQQRAGALEPQVRRDGHAQHGVEDRAVAPVHADQPMNLAAGLAADGCRDCGFGHRRGRTDGRAGERGARCERAGGVAVGAVGEATVSAACVGRCRVGAQSPPSWSDTAAAARPLFP